MLKQRSYQNRYLTGKLCAPAIIQNLKIFWDIAREMHMDQEAARIQKGLTHPLLSEERYEEIRGMAEGARVGLGDLLAYQILQPQLLPEGCTVFFAAGKASGTGSTIFGKNSDKGGNEQFVGERYHNFHEINVVSWFENEDGSHIVGVSSAGTTGLKMGLNSYGVAVGTNYGYSAAAQKKSLSASDKLAGDRAQIARDALSKKTALEAAQYTVARLLEQPMASSGMLEFADADEVYLVENVYEQVAVKKVKDDVDSRSNYLVVLDALNEPGNASCYCRYHRTQKLLSQLRGKGTLEDFKKISMDHHDGTGSVGICRHTDGLDSSTQSAAIMELNREDPKKSVIHIALGKPCHAWRMEDGHVSISMDMERDQIPEAFFRGEAYIKYGTAAPLL